MKTLFPLAAAALFAALLPLAAPAAESPSILLQKGIYAEETEGNVDAAIKIYEQIATEAATNRAVVAQAQYRLAVCYQKKGNKEQAIKLLEELVQQLPSDPDVNKLARGTLSQLGVAASNGVAIRKLPLPVGWVWAISRDGKYIAYEPVAQTNLAIYEIATGKSWTAFKGAVDTEPWSVVFSPGNKQIAYSIRGVKIWIANIDGTEPRMLYEDKKARKDEDGPSGHTWFTDWSETTGLIRINSWDEGLALELDPKTGLAKEYAHLDPSGREDWLPSSAGEWAARIKTDFPHSLTLVNLKSQHEETVSDRDAVELYGWIANDSKLVYSKARAGGIDLWAVAVSGGLAFGAPEMIWSNLGDVSAGGTTDDGTIYYFTKEKYPQPKGLWVMEGLFTRTIPATANSVNAEIPPEEILGSNHGIHERNFGFSFNYPENWTLKSAVHAGWHGQDSLIGFTVSESASLTATVYYTDPKTSLPGSDKPTLRQVNSEVPNPKTNEEIDSWLRRFTQLAAEGRMRPGTTNAKFYAGFENHPETFAFRTLNGHRSLSWTSGFARNGVDKDWKEDRTTVYAGKVLVQFVIVGPAAEVDAARPAFDQMVETFRL